jgi:predicted PurR-regulated permease PerM
MNIINSLNALSAKLHAHTEAQRRRSVERNMANALKLQAQIRHALNRLESNAVRYWGAPTLDAVLRRTLMVRVASFLMLAAASASERLAHWMPRSHSPESFELVQTNRRNARRLYRMACASYYSARRSV